MISSFICTSIILLEVWNTRLDYIENAYTPQTHTVTSTVTTTTSQTSTVTATNLVTATVTQTATKTHTITATKTATTTTTATETVTRTVTVTITPNSVDSWISLIAKEYDNNDAETSTEFTTSHHCTRFGDASGFCVYKNLCFNGNSLLFIDPTVTERISVQALQGGMGWDARYHFPNRFPPGDTKYIPYSGSGLPSYMHVLPPSNFNYSNFQWTNQTIWFAKSYNPAGSPSHFAKENALLWELQIYNKTVGNLLPSIDVVVMGRSAIPPGWSLDMWNTVYKQPHTVVWLDHDLTSFQDKPICMKRYFRFQIFRSSISDSRFQFFLFLFYKFFLSFFYFFYFFLIFFLLFAGFFSAVVVSDKPRLFSGIENGEKFRRAVYERLAIPYPDERGFKRPPNYVPKVLITNRPGRTSRRFYNIEELERLLAHYQLEFKVLPAFSPETSLATQVQSFQDVDLYIVVHGGGAINSMFLPAHASLIELFPYGLKDPEYEYIASPLGTSLPSFLPFSFF